MYDIQSKTWKGILGQIQNGEAEMSIFQFSVLLRRSNIVSFSNPVGTAEFGLYMQRPKQSYSWSTFTKVFYIDYWITVLLVAVVCCLTLFCVFELADKGKRMGNGKKNRKEWEIEKTLNYKFRRIANNFGSGFSIVGLSFGQQDVNHGRQLESGSSTSTKILYFTVCLFGALNYMAWDASLTSTLTVQRFQHPINSLEDLIYHRDYQLMVYKGTSSESYFSDTSESERDSVVRQLWKETLENNKDAMVYTNEEQETAVLKDKKNVMFADDLSAKMWANYPCKITVGKTRYNKHSLAYPFKKNSTFIRLFDTVLNKMKETGTLSSIQRHGAQFRPLPNCKDERKWSIGYQNIFSGFVLSSIGCLMAVMIWFAEYAYCYLFSRRKLSNKFGNTPQLHVRSNDLKTVELFFDLVDKLDDKIVRQHESSFITILNAIIEKMDCNIEISNIRR